MHVFIEICLLRIAEKSSKEKKYMLTIKCHMAVKNIHQFGLLSTFEAKQNSQNTSVITKRLFYESFMCFIMILDSLNDPNFNNLRPSQPLLKSMAPLLGGPGSQVGIQGSSILIKSLKTFKMLLLNCLLLH